MVGLGVLMLLLTLASLWAWWRGWMFDESGRARWLWQGWRLLSPAGFIALLAGWYVVEIGRQPYVVYGLLRTSEAVSPNITAAAVMSSLITYACAYARSEEHTSELQSLMRISYAVFCLKKKKNKENK